MEPHANYLILVILSLVVISSHLFDVLAKLARIPSVLLLLAVGMLLRFIALYFNFEITLDKYLVLFGNVGLILIVLEGAMDLKINRNNIPVIGKAFSAALAILLLSCGLITFLISFWLGCNFKNAFVNSIPIAVISSAIAIPTVRHLNPHLKEFITYESIFSDILGILMFNIVIHQAVSHFYAIISSFLSIFLIVILSFATSLVLVVMMRKIEIPVKFIFILSVLILIYSLGRLLNLPTLFLILIFGLLLSNAESLGGKWFLKFLRSSKINGDFEQFKVVVAEITFLIRTFFFVIFGYMIELQTIMNINTIILAGLIIIILLSVRYLYLKTTLKTDIIPALFIAPRGLVTILLFYSIPYSLKINYFEEGIVFFVILVTSLLMLVGTLVQKKHPEGAKA